MSHYLGQAQNRLLGLKTHIILSRRLLYEIPNEFNSDEGVPPDIRFVAGADAGGPDFDTLALIRANPSQEEIADLGLIDAFWGPAWAPDLTGGGDIVKSQNAYPVSFGKLSLSQVLGYYMCQLPSWLTIPQEFIGLEPDPPSRAPFCCPPLPDLPDPYSPESPNVYLTLIHAGSAGYRFYPIPASPRAIFWDRALGSPWGELKAQIPNYIEVEKVLEWYPFPEPFRQRFAFILAKYLISELRAVAQLPALLNDTVVRMTITLNILANYEAMAAEVQDWLEESAERKRRHMIIQKIVITAFTTLIGAGLAAAAVSSTISTLVTKGISSISDLYSKQKQADFAAQVESVSDAFKEDNPAFSKEIKFTADVLKYLSEDDGKLAQLSPAEQAEIASGGSGIGTLEIAGIGAAALIALYLAGVFD